MAKQAASGKVNIESLFKEVQGLSDKLSAGMDSLIAEDVEAFEAYNQKRQAIQEQVKQLHDLYRSATGKDYAPAADLLPSNGKAKGKSEGTRKRRSREELEKMAAEIIGHIKQGGKTGVTGAEIKGKFGSDIQSVNSFLKTYAPDYKVRTEGSRSQMRYLS